MKKILIAIILFYSFPVFADWTQPAAKIKAIYPRTNTVAWVQLDTSVSVSNPNNCSIHDNWFKITDLNGTLGKANWSLAQMAYAMNHKITIDTTFCSGGYNNIYNIQLDRENN